MRWRWWMVLVAATGGFLAGCAPKEDGAGPATFVFARGADAQKLDPADVDDGESVNSLMQVFEGLLAFKPGTTELVPWLAESYSVSDDGLTYTFGIRPDVVFHDGTPLDAEAAAYSFRRQLDPDHPAHFASASFSYWPLLFGDIVAVETPAPMTLRFRLARPNAAVLYAFATFPAFLVSPAAMEREGEGFARNPVGTGPFRFVNWRPNEAMVFERFGDYWGEPAGMERLVMRSIPLNATRLAELRAGHVHGLDGLQPAELEDVRADARFRVLHAPGANVGYLAISERAEALREPEVRQAIALAINRQEVLHLALDGYGSVAEWPVPPGFPAMPSEPGPVSYDPEAARAIIERHPHLRSTTLRLSTFTEPRMYFPDPARVASLVRSDLEAVGLRVEVVNREFQRHLHLVRRGEFDLALLGWMADAPDPSSFLDTFFHSRSAVVGAATNIALYRNPEMDALLEAARAASDPDRRRELYRAALDLWAQDLPLIPLVHGDQIVVMRQELQGYALDPMGNHIFAPVKWVSEAP